MSTRRSGGIRPHRTGWAIARRRLLASIQRPPPERHRMHRRILLAAAAACAIHVPLAAAGPLDPLKARVKPGLYDMAVQVEPVGEKPQAASTQTCVTTGNLDKGDLFGDG